MDFRTIAAEATTLSPLMDGRTKITMEDIKKTYPDGITVIGFDSVPSSDGEFYFIGIFEEDTSKFFNGGLVFTKMCMAWMNNSEGTCESLSNELIKSGGIKLKFDTKKVKDSNRTVTTITVI